MKYLFCLLLVISTLLPPARGQSQCSCPESLARLQELIKRNYAGYTDKLTPATEAAHRALYARLQTQAAPISQEAACVTVLEQYLAFWADKHLYLTGATTAATPPATYSLTRAKAQAYFDANRAKLHPLEGFWSIEESYQLAVVRDLKGPRNSFVGVVMTAQNPAWKPGMVKVTLRATGSQHYDVLYTAGDFSRDSTQAVLGPNRLDVLRYGQLRKTYPRAAQPSVAAYPSPFPQTDIEFRFPDDSTAVLVLASFATSNKALVDSLLALHRAALQARPNWILDVRYNSGGGTGTYEGLLPYLYTGPMVRSGSQYRLSPDNVRNYETLLTAPLPPPVRQFFARLVAQGKAAPDTWADEPNDTLRLAAPRPIPRRVAILANRHTFSSAEILLLHARQSRKVTVFGENSGGVVDYGDGTSHPLGCGAVQVSIPVRRSNYLRTTRYDGTGVAPDVRIPAAERDWYGFVRRYWRNPAAAPR